MKDAVADISLVRRAFAAADATNDAGAIGETLADDVVILHPQGGVITGKDAACEFMRAVLDDVQTQYRKEVRYSTIELHVCGDWAFERGEFEQLLQPRNDGPPVHERGQYLWVYARNGDGRWRLARIAGAFIHRDEGGDDAVGVDR